MSHTPGTWTVSELDATGEISEHHIFIEPGVAVIERKVAGQNQCDMDDALLLAAAKDLFEAAQILIASMPAHACYRNAKERKAYEKFRAAIAKATGATP